MKAIEKHSPNRGARIIEKKIPVPSSEEVLIKVGAAGICGSDIHFYEWGESMHTFGDNLPFVLGHEFAGEVVEIGGKVVGVNLGDRVTCFLGRYCGKCYYCKRGFYWYCKDRFREGIERDGGFAEYTLIRGENCIPLPNNVSLAQGSLVEPLSVSARAVNQVSIQLGDTVVVIGPGIIGIGVMYMAKLSGARVIVSGTKSDESRLNLCKEMGADRVVNVDEEDLKEVISKDFCEEGVDLVIEAAGVPEVINKGLQLLKRGGHLICIGIQDFPTTIDMIELVRGSKRIIGSYATLKSDWFRVIDLLSKDKKNELGKTISHVYSLDEVEEAFEMNRSRSTVKSLFLPHGRDFALKTR